MQKLFGWCDDPEDGDSFINDESLSYGFDVDYSSCPYRLIKSEWGDSYDIDLFGRMGLHCYNFQKGTNFKFVRWEKYDVDSTRDVNFYITLEAKDPACDSVLSFQTLVSDAGCAIDIIEWQTLACRIKCNERLDDDWCDTAIDDFYKSQMPKWLSSDELACDSKKYYVVEDSELHVNDWLHLLSELAFFAKTERRLTASPPLEIKKVVVETREEDTREPCEKLKAENAIFYISYKYNGDHKAVVRKTMDGKPGHMSLEVSEG